MHLTKEIADQSIFNNLRPNVLNMNQAVRDVANESEVSIIDLYSVICDDLNERCHALTTDGYAVFMDSNHLTREGAEYIGQLAAEAGVFDDLILEER